MRGCLAVVIGLAIGAGLSFSVLAVAALAARPGAGCPSTPTAVWSVRVDVPRELVREELSRAPLIVPGWGTLTANGLAVADCGHVILRGEWLGDDGRRVGDLGVEVQVLASDDGAVQVLPVSLWLGRLPLPLGLLPSEWSRPVLERLNQQLSATINGQLQGSGLVVCDAGATDYGMSVYLCQEGSAASR